MSGFLQQLPTLLGVVVGALTSFLVTSAGERVRWRRSQAVRWDENRMRIYADYAAAVKRWAYLACRVAAARGFDHSAVPLPPEDGLPALAEAEDQRGARWESVLLLGTPETVAAARDWHQAVHRLDWFARGRLTNSSEWRPAIKEMERLRDRFYECARRDLGVSSGSLPPPYWPPEWVPKPHDGSTETR
jgi:hypothetical protein